MELSASAVSPNMKRAVSDNRLVGLWFMMEGFRKTYISAALMLGLAAISKTGTFLLLRYFVDDILGANKLNGQTLPLIAFGFVLFAVFEGTFTFLSGRLAAQTAEGLALRLRNYLFDHVQHLSFSYHDQTKTGELVQRSTTDVDAIRTFFQDQAIELGRVVILFAINFVAVVAVAWRPWLASGLGWAVLLAVFFFFFWPNLKGPRKSQTDAGPPSTILPEYPSAGWRLE